MEKYCKNRQSALLPATTKKLALTSSSNPVALPVSSTEVLLPSGTKKLAITSSSNPISVPTYPQNDSLKGEQSGKVFKNCTINI